MTDRDPEFMNDFGPRPPLRPGLKALLAVGIVVTLVVLAVAAII